MTRDTLISSLVAATNVLESSAHTFPSDNEHADTQAKLYALFVSRPTLIREVCREITRVEINSKQYDRDKRKRLASDKCKKARV